MRAFVIADAHGNYDAIEGLLRQEGLFDDGGALYEPNEVKIVQLGDLMNCVEDSYHVDMDILVRTENLFDVQLVGNHEHPYWDGYINKFWGFQFYPEIKERMFEQPWVAAFHFGGVLVTHAGLARIWEDRYETAEEAATDLNKTFREAPDANIFNMIGMRRGGKTVFGGVLWSDEQEKKSRKFSQVFGHTPGKIRMSEVSKYGTVSVCIDLGAKTVGRPIAGAWIDEDGTITPVVYNPDPTLDALGFNQ